MLVRMDLLHTPFGSVELTRYPTHDTDQMRAYDGADRYLLEEIAQRHADAQSILVVGDRHGALSTALAERYDVTMWSDSALSRIAARANLASAGRTAVLPDRLPELRYDLVVVRPGKARSLLEQQLHEVAGRIEPGTPVIVGEMVKHLGRWMTEVLERQVGPTTASLAARKARLLRATRDERRADAPAWTTYEAPGSITLQNAPGTFASSGVDAGTRLLLAHLPESLGASQVVDLGCGNGVLGIASALRNREASYLLVDESAAAIASAQASWQANLPTRPVDLLLGDGLEQAAPESVDVVLCNPPFHAGTTVDDWLGRRLLEQAHRALRVGGRLYTVANRHLPHHRYLRQAYAAVEVLGADARFSVLRAVR